MNALAPSIFPGRSRQNGERDRDRDRVLWALCPHFRRQSALGFAARTEKALPLRVSLVKRYDDLRRELLDLEARYKAATSKTGRGWKEELMMPGYAYSCTQTEPAPGDAAVRNSYPHLHLARLTLRHVRMALSPCFANIWLKCAPLSAFSLRLSHSQPRAVQPLSIDKPLSLSNAGSQRAPSYPRSINLRIRTSSVFAVFMFDASTPCFSRGKSFDLYKKNCIVAFLVVRS